MTARHLVTIRRRPRRGFTLAELLVVIMVIGLLASTVLFALYGAAQQAKVSRTRTQITKLNELLMTRWDSYRTRPIRMLSLPPQARHDARAIATARLVLLRDLMRMEMPDRKSDVWDKATMNNSPVQFSFTYAVQGQNYPATVSVALPAVAREYAERARKVGWQNWSDTYADSECLYMIIASVRDITANGLDFLHESEVGDKDGDKMPEILDAWGNPIAFLRWPAGYLVHPGKLEEWGVENFDDDGVGGTDDFGEAGWPGTDDIPYYTNLQRIVLDASGDVEVGWRDSFDPFRRATRPSVPVFSTPSTSQYYFGFAIYPLVCSGGPDEKIELVRFDFVPATPDVLVPFDYYRSGLNPYPPARWTNDAAWPNNAPWPNDPYSILPTSRRRLGEPFIDSFGYVDNITNHALGD